MRDPQSILSPQYVPSLIADNARLQQAVNTALDYMTNAAIDLDTGASKKTALKQIAAAEATINGGIIAVLKLLEDKTP